MDPVHTSNDEILKLMDSSDTAVKVEIINQLNDEIVDDRIIEKLCKLLANEDKWVRFSTSVKLKSLKYANIPFILVNFIPSPDIGLRNLAGEILLGKKNESLTALINFLPKGNDDDKKFVIDIIGLIGDKGASKIIKEVFNTSQNDNVILACIETFGNIHCEHAVEEIVNVYDKKEVYKPTAVEALGKIGTDKALKFIISRFDNEDTLTQFSMIEALGLIGSEETYFFCLNQLNKTTGPLIWSLLDSIYQLKQKFGFDIPYDEKIKNSILYTLAKGETKYKLAAAHIVSSLSDVDLLIETLQVIGIDPKLDDEIKSNIFKNAGILLPKITALINRSSPNLKHLLNIIVELLFLDKSKFISCYSQLEMRNLIDSAASSLENPDEEVRKSAMELLFGIDNETAFLFADTMLGDSNTWNKLKLVEFFERVTNEKSKEYLLKLSEDPEIMIADRALFALSSRNIATTTMETKN